MMVLSASREVVIWMTMATIVLYSTNFWVQQNTMPFLIKKFGADAIAFGHLQTVFALLQLLGSPLYGRLGDLAGARVALIAAFCSCLVSYLLLAMASSVTSLFVSRIPIILMHAMQGGQMVVTDLTPADKRVAALGRLGVAYAIGMVVGNVLGGVSTKMAGEQASALIAAGGTVLNLILVLLFIPHSVKRRRSAGEAAGPNANAKPNLSDDESAQEDAAAPARPPPPKGSFLLRLLDVEKLRELLGRAETRHLLTVKLLTGVPIGLLQSMFPIVAVSIFKVDPMSNGMILAYVAVVSMLMQGVVLPVVNRRVKERLILRYSVVCLGFSYLGLAFVTDLRQFCAVMLPLVVGLTSLNVVITSTLTKAVSSEDTGSILGVNMSINNVIRIVSPAVGGWMLSRWGFSAFGWLGTVMSAATLAFIAAFGPPPAPLVIS